MYNNSGRKIFTLANVLTKILFAISIIGGIVVLVIAINNDVFIVFAILAGAVVAALGCVLAWLANLLLAGFGELVMNTQDMVTLTEKCLALMEARFSGGEASHQHMTEGQASPNGVQLVKPEEPATLPEEPSDLPAEAPQPPEPGVDWAKALQQPEPTEDWAKAVQPPEPAEDWAKAVQPPEPAEDWAKAPQPTEPAEDWAKAVQPPEPIEDWVKAPQPPEPTEDWTITLQQPEPVEDWAKAVQPPEPTEDWTITLQQPEPAEDWAKAVQPPEPTEDWTITLQQPEPIEDWAKAPQPPEPTDDRMFSTEQAYPAFHPDAFSAAQQKKPDVDDREQAYQSIINKISEAKSHQNPDDYKAMLCEFEQLGDYKDARQILRGLMRPVVENDDRVVCSFCGARQQSKRLVCYYCGIEFIKNDPVKIEASYEQVIRCSSCGKELPGDSHFCDSCGATIPQA